MTDLSNGDSPQAQIRIRRAGVADARAIAAITVAGWQVAYRGMLPDDYLDRLSVDAREAAWFSMLGADDPAASPAWIAERGGDHLGFASSGPPRDADVPDNAREVYALYVRPDAWRSGVGRELLTRAAAHWAAAGASFLVLWVLERNVRARAFYEAMGMQADGARQSIDLADLSVIEVRYRLRLEGGRQLDGGRQLAGGGQPEGVRDTEGPD